MLKDIFKIKKINKINFAFLGGSSLNNNIYESNGYKNFVNLFEDYIRHKGPYIFDDKDNKEIYARRYVFDLSIENYCLKDVVENFDYLLSNNNILVFVLTIDYKDVVDINNKEFEKNLKKFIELCFQYNKESFVIIRNHFNTYDNQFNIKNKIVNELINKVVIENYNDCLNKKIIIVNHCLLSDNKNFYENCLVNNKLNNYGQLEMANQFINTIFSNSISIYEVTSSKENIENNNIINHNLSQNTHFLSIKNESKITRFQKYIDSLKNAWWIFVGDSLTHDNAFNKGYSSLPDYFRWLIKNEFNRKNDCVLNMGVSGNSYILEYSKDYNDLIYLNYKFDVIHLWIGTNDITRNNFSDLENEQYFKKYLNETYEMIKNKNPKCWIIISTITPSFSVSKKDYFDKQMNQANKVISDFCNSKDDVILNDLNYVASYFINKEFKNDIYVKDFLHFQPNAYVLFSKNLLNVLGFDFSKTKFYNF